MLRIRDKEGKLRFILKDDEEEPLSIDELVLNDQDVEGEENADDEDRGGK